MKSCKSLYSIYNGRLEASEKTEAKKNNFGYICEDTQKNREILSGCKFPKYLNKNNNTLIF